MIVFDGNLHLNVNINAVLCDDYRKKYNVYDLDNANDSED